MLGACWSMIVFIGRNREKKSTPKNWCKFMVHGLSIKLCWHHGKCNGAGSRDSKVKCGIFYSFNSGLLGFITIDRGVEEAFRKKKVDSTFEKGWGQTRKIKLS